MLQTLRDKTTGWVAVAILILLTVPFAFFGVENYFQQQVSTYVAKINKVEITQDQFRERFEDHRSRMRQMLGDRYDAREFDTPIVKRQVLESLIDEEVLRQAAEKYGLVVAPGTLQKEIASIEAFQVNGSFDPNQYKLVLAGARMTPRSFESRMSRDLLTRALPIGVSESGIVTDDYVNQYLALRDQTRSFDYLVLPAPAEDTAGEISDTDLSAYYESHSDLYQSPETFSVEYLELDASTLDVDEKPDEAALRERYEENKSRYVESEQRLASHILIQTPANADAAAVQAAQAKAQAIVEKARAKDADFAAIARESSEDPGSSAAGGDLGWIERGVTDAAFEDALFSMQPGVSDPVKGADGWHVIWLREVKPESGKSFEDVRVELEKEYLESERERRYSELAGKLIDAIYRDPSTLDAAAAELGLEVKKAGPLTRAGGPGVFSNPEVLRAMLSDSVLVEGLASDVIEVAPGHGIALRISEHVPASTRPLEEVKAQVVAAVRAERLAEIGRQTLAKALETITSVSSLEAYAKEHGLEVKKAEAVGRMGATVDPAIARAAFGLAHPAEGSSSIGSASLVGGSSAVIAVTQVIEGDPAKVEASQREMIRSQLAQGIGGVEAADLVKALRREAKIDVAESRM
ncbi:MAG TPA: SurA N-terminal domain-containing protein [Chiayiivirga sp.]|nr:SurA N-terminal domain-containing protein [Chiayiivirga sp.]